MHSNFNELEADSNSRSWLKGHKCPDEIISDILKENSRQYNRKLERHIKSCPRLFTALLDNGYGYEAIEDLFLDKNWDKLKNQEDLAIELVKNKCRCLCISLMCQLEDSKKFFNHKAFYIELLKKLSSFPVLGLRVIGILDFFAVDCNEQKLEKCMSNQKLLNLLIENYLPSKMLEGILQKDDYKTLNINNNKELLDLLLKEKLIFSDNDDPSDESKKELVTEDTLIHNLLQINALKIYNLLHPNGDVFISRTSDIKKKAEKVAKSVESRIKEIQAQSTLPNTHHAKAPNLVEQVIEKLRCNQNKVPSLLALSIGAILNPQVEEVKALQEKQQNGWCSIL